MSHEKPIVVVGYDGSPASRAAVVHAARRVRAGGCLSVVHAYRVPADYWGVGYYEILLDEVAAEARKLMERLPHEIDALADVEWHGELLGESPSQAIADVAATRDADEIVVGSRGFSRARALLGSVSHELIHLAPCPVTVIPERAVEEAPADRAAEAAAA
jgi:nucleotide-binding universal stress UspA family protein